MIPKSEIRNPKPQWLILFAVVILAVATGCGGDESEPTPTRPAPTAAPKAEEKPAEEVTGYQEIEVTDGGTIKGTVTFKGTPPEPEMLTVDKDQEVCGQEKPSRALLVSADGGIQNAVVSIPDIAAGKPMSALQAGTELDQKDCRYEPHVLIAPVGAEVQVANGDPLMHNVHTYSFVPGNPRLNKSQPKDSAPLAASLKAAEEIQVGCDVHSWMGAWMVAAANPYYAATGEAGSFELTDVPAGTYELKVWHETLGTQTQTVTVEAGGTAEVTFELSQ